jgi:hypothetical protein
MFFYTVDYVSCWRECPAREHNETLRKVVKTKKASDFSEAFLVAGTGLEPVTFGL